MKMMMEAASTSETSVNFYQTIRRNNPEDSHLLLRNVVLKVCDKRRFVTAKLYLKLSTA
jgi:hypothetical protein